MSLMISYLRPGTCLVVSSVVLFRCDVEGKSPYHRVSAYAKFSLLRLVPPHAQKCIIAISLAHAKAALDSCACVLYMMALGRINNGKNFCVLNFRSGGNCCDVAITLSGWFLCETLLIAPGLMLFYLGLLACTWSASFVCLDVTGVASVLLMVGCLEKNSKRCHNRIRCFHATRGSVIQHNNLILEGVP